jgi:hypothetical protein
VAGTFDLVIVQFAFAQRSTVVCADVVDGKQLAVYFADRQPAPSDFENSCLTLGHVA